MWFLGFGYAGLFIGSFLASTLIPFPSEGLLIGGYEIGLDVIACLIIATVGNFLGGVTNYYIGYKSNNEKLIKRFKLSEEKIEKWRQRFSKWGIWLGLISWVPFIGDPMVAVLGFFKVKIIPLCITMFIGKFLRYLILTLIYLELVF